MEANNIRTQLRHTCTCTRSELWELEITCTFYTERSPITQPAPAAKTVDPALAIPCLCKHHSKRLRTRTSTQWWHLTLGIFRGWRDPSHVLSLPQSREGSPRHSHSSGSKSAPLGDSVTSQPRTLVTYISKCQWPLLQSPTTTTTTRFPFPFSLSKGSSRMVPRIHRNSNYTAFSRTTGLLSRGTPFLS